MDTNCAVITRPLLMQNNQCLSLMLISLNSSTVTNKNKITKERKSKPCFYDIFYKIIEALWSWSTKSSLLSIFEVNELPFGDFIYEMEDNLLPCLNLKLSIFCFKLNYNLLNSVLSACFAVALPYHLRKTVILQKHARSSWTQLL